MMGIFVLQTIELRLQELEQTLGILEHTLAESTQRRNQIEQDLHQKLARMAQVRLQALEQGQLQPEQADDQAVQELLSLRETGLEQLRGQIRAAEAERERSGQALNEAHAAEAEATVGVEQAQARFQAEMAALPAWVERHEALLGRQQQAQQLQARLERTQTEQGARLKSFEDEPLFMYLQQRGYLTPAYRANPLERLLDARVARLCNYPAAQRDYSLLKALPDYLQRQYQEQAALAATARQALEAFEAAEGRRAGVEQAQARLASCSAAVLAARAGLEQARTAVTGQQAKLAPYTAGEDPLFLEAQQLLATRFPVDDVNALLAWAHATADPADDALARSVAALRNQSERIREEDLRKRQDGDAKRRAMNRLLQLSAQFQAAGYTAADSGFNGKLELDDLLDDLIGGQQNGDQVWQALVQHHRREETALELVEFSYQTYPDGTLERHGGQPPAGAALESWSWSARKGSSHVHRR